jgi:AraC family transcriptional regulator
MATIEQGCRSRDRRKARHFQRHVGGLSVYYHASIERQELGRHAHEQIQISIPLYKNKTSSGIVSGHVDVIPGFEEHAMDWGGAREVVVIHFGSSFLTRAIEAPNAIAERPGRRTKTDPFVSEVGLTLRRELLRHDTIDEFLLASLGTVLAGYLFKTEGLRSEDETRPVSHLTYEQSRRAIEMMNANQGARVSLLDIASELGLSQWHFSRQFRKTTGQSPYQFLLRSRVDRARRLLEHGCGISEAAATTGFTDQSHMHRHFKRILGTTPGRLRRRK